MFHEKKLIDNLVAVFMLIFMFYGGFLIVLENELPVPVFLAMIWFIINFKKIFSDSDKITLFLDLLIYIFFSTLITIFLGLIIVLNELPSVKQFTLPTCYLLATAIYYGIKKYSDQLIIKGLTWCLLAGITFVYGFVYFYML